MRYRQLLVIMMFTGIMVSAIIALIAGVFWVSAPGSPTVVNVMKLKKGLTYEEVLFLLGPGEERLPDMRPTNKSGKSLVAGTRVLRC